MISCDLPIFAATILVNMTFEDTTPKDDGSDSQEEGSLAKRKERLEQNRISARECEFHLLLIGADVKGESVASGH